MLSLYPFTLLNAAIISKKKKKTNGGEETVLAYKIIAINKSRKNEGTTASPLGKYYSKNCGRQDSLKDVLISE